MEEKLDKIIKLLENQNRLLGQMINSQTTNNSTVQQNTPVSHIGPNLNHPNAPGANKTDVKKMIEEARAKAMAQIQQKVGNISHEG